MEAQPCRTDGSISPRLFKLPLPKRNRKAPEGLISGAFRLPLRTIHFILPTGIIAYALCNTFGNTFQMYYITHLLISC